VNDSRPARIADAMPSIGRPACSHAVARRTFCASAARNGPAPSPGHQDAQANHQVDLGLRHARQIGQLGG
jgi:hypothetical protein